MPTTQQFTEVLKDQNGVTLDPAGQAAPVWASSNTNVATVNATGLATRGTQAGTANITVTRGGVTSNAGVITVPSSAATTMADLIASLVGGNSAVPAAYDVRNNVEETVFLGGVSYECGKWSDSRGVSGYGPALEQGTGINRPIWDQTAKTLTFDGSKDFMQTALSAALAIMAGECSIVVIGTLDPTAGKYALTLHGTNPTDASTRWLTAGMYAAGIGAESNKGGATIAQSGVAGSAALRRIVIASKNATTDLSINVPNVARVSIVGGAALSENSNSQLTLAGLFGASAQSMAMVVRAVMVLNRQATADDITRIRDWAVAQHGAVAA